MKIERDLLRKIVEGALLAADAPMNQAKLVKLFELPEGSDADVGDLYEVPGTDEILSVIDEIRADCEGRGYELKQVASGWRFQVVQEVSPWINRLWEEKPQRYSRALLETLALIAYRQPLTRGDIESIRGVAVSSTIIKTLTEREWVKVVGHRDVPGRPALYATTRQFLDYFNLKSLDELPSLKEIQDFDKLEADLDLNAIAGALAPEDADAPLLGETEVAAGPDAAGLVVSDSAIEADEADGIDGASLVNGDDDDDESDEMLTLDEPFASSQEDSELEASLSDEMEPGEDENSEADTALEREDL